MAKNSNNDANTSAEDTVEETQVPERSASIDVDVEHGGNVLAAWRGIYHLLGGRADKFNVIPGKGIEVKGFSVSGQYDPNQVVTDVSGRDRRGNLLDSLPILNGEAPPAFTGESASLDMTKWMQQFFRTPGTDGKSPEYIKDAIKAYKTEQGFPGRRGRPKRIIRIDQLGKLDIATLAQVNLDDLNALEDLINKVRAQNNGANSSAESTEAEAATL